MSMNHQMGELLYYNVSAGNKNFVADFIRLKLNFFSKKSLFEPPFGGLRGNACTLPIDRWKAHG